MTHSFDKTVLEQIQDSIRRFAKRHAVGIGVAEILAGGALLAYSYQDLGALFATKEVAGFLPEGMGIASGATGAAAMLLKVGGVGIAALGTAFGVPAGVVAGVGFVVIGALGYKAGDLLKEFMEPSWFDVIKSVGLAGLGLLLVLDGLRRVRQSPKVAALLATLTALTKRGVQRLVQKVVATAQLAMTVLRKEWSDWLDFNAAVRADFKTSSLGMKALKLPGMLTAMLFA